MPTLDGRTLAIPCPEVISPGGEKVVLNEGMPLSKKPNEGKPEQRGNLIIRFSVTFPEYLSEDKKLQLRKLLT